MYIENILIYIYINMYKYSYNMQYWYIVDDIVYAVLTVLHPSHNGLQVCDMHHLLFQSANVYYNYRNLNTNCTGFKSSSGTYEL